MLPTPTSPISTSFDPISSVSKTLRDLDDALAHAIDQLAKFNGETMSDLSLKYELMRNNESRVITFFARQLMHLQEEKLNGQSNSLHSDYWKLDRFLLALNFNQKSIDFLVKRITFDDLLHDTEDNNLEQILSEADTSDTEKKDFRNAVSALKNCINCFSHDRNDNDQFYWHIEAPTVSSPVTSKPNHQHRTSDTILPIQSNNDSARSTSVSSSVSTDFGTSNSVPHSAPIPPTSQGTYRTGAISKFTLSNANGKSKWEHPAKKISVDPSIFMPSNSNQNRTNDLPVPDPGNSSRRSSCGSDNESRLPSGSATPMSPTVRSPTLSGSPIGSAQNSDTENDNRHHDAWSHSTNSPMRVFRMAHKIQHKWNNLIKLTTCNVCNRRILFFGTRCNICKFDRTRVFKFSFCDVCKKQIFRGKSCIHCKYKCHKECVSNAPPNCGFSEVKFRRMIDSTPVQSAIAQSTPLPRKHQPTNGYPSPSGSAPPSPAPKIPPLSVSETIYSTQNDPDSWVVIETNVNTLTEPPESQSNSENNSIIQIEPSINIIDSISSTSSTKTLVRQVSQSEPTHPTADDLVKRKIFDINSFDDDEADPEKRNINLDQSLQDSFISYQTIKFVENVRRSSGNLTKCHWHGEVAVRRIEPNPQMSNQEFLQKFKIQVFHLRKVRHENLNLYTGFCVESPNIAIVSNWIRGPTLYELIHIQNDNIALSLAVQYGAQITQAMSYLHEKKICHKSLQTSNIYIQNNRIILTDYGLFPLKKSYRIIDEPAIIARRGWLCYLAPEIIRKIDPKNEQSLNYHTNQTDIYAFGTVWYEIVCREFPFAKQPVEYIIWRAGNSLKQPLSSVQISKYAKDIINQCWSYIPEDRPDFAMLCKSLMKFPSKRNLVRSPSTPLQHHSRPNIEN